MERMLKILLGVVLAMLILPFIIHWVVRLRMKDLREGILVEASREAPIGGIWLGLYKDRHFNFGYFDFWGIDTVGKGYYKVRKDTLTLDSTTENTVLEKKLHFLILKNGLMQLPKDSGGIGYLKMVKGSQNNLLAR